MVRIGVIGGGNFGINHLRAFRQAEYTGLAKLVALSELNEDLLEKRKAEFGMKGYTDYKEMLEKEDLDGVTIVTPDFLHKQIALDAFAAGVHVLSEKPLDVTVEGCQAMIDASKKAGKLLQVDFHKRYDSDHISLNEFVEAGKLGKVEYGYVHMEDRIEVPRDWFPRWAPKSSPSWFLGVHFYDLVRWILKSDASKVYATGIKGKLSSLGVDTYDSIQAKVEFKNGATVTFDTSWILPESFEAVVNQGIRLVGSEGVWEVDTQDRGCIGASNAEGMRTYNSHFLMESKDKKGRQIYTGYGIGSILDFAENIAFLKDGGSIKDMEGKYPSGEDGREVTRIAVAIHDSVRTGEIIKL